MINKFFFEVNYYYQIVLSILSITSKFTDRKIHYPNLLDQRTNYSERFPTLPPRSFSSLFILVIRYRIEFDFPAPLTLLPARQCLSVGSTEIFQGTNARAIIFRASPPPCARLPARRMLVRRSPDNNIRVTHAGIHFQTSISRLVEALRSFQPLAAPVELPVRSGISRSLRLSVQAVSLFVFR